MSKNDSKFQVKFMSFMFKGKEIFKPLNTGFIDDRVSCIREYVANIYFYTKDGHTIMIDAGYNYDRLAEKMQWLHINPKEIKEILVTHQDTDHVGAIEQGSDELFSDATIYIGKVENEYLEGHKHRKVFWGLTTLPQVVIDNQKVLIEDGQVFYIGNIKVEAILVPGHTWGHLVYLIDDEYLFTGDTIWFGADGGYAFLNTLAEDRKLQCQSLQRLKEILEKRNLQLRLLQDIQDGQMTLPLHLHILMKSAIHSEENRKYMIQKLHMMVLKRARIQKKTQEVDILHNVIRLYKTKLRISGVYLSNNSFSSFLYSSICSSVI